MDGLALSSIHSVRPTDAGTGPGLVWRKYWGTETLTLDGAGIMLTGRQKVRYSRPRIDMNPLCNAPF